MEEMHQTAFGMTSAATSTTCMAWVNQTGK
jgi:hypothetical protein